MIRLLSLVILFTFFASPAYSDTYALDPTHTYVLFSVQHKGLAPNWGRFNRTTGTIELNSDISKNKVTVEIDATSVDTGHPKRDAHLRNADFFDAGQFPKIRFTSTTWKSVDPNTFEVTGEMNFHGITKPLVITLKKTGEGTDRKGRHKIGFTANFTLDRFAHGVTYGAKGIGQMVNIIVSAETTKQTP